MEFHTDPYQTYELIGYTEHALLLGNARGDIMVTARYVQNLDTDGPPLRGEDTKGNYRAANVTLVSDRNSVREPKVVREPRWNNHMNHPFTEYNTIRLHRILIPYCGVIAVGFSPSTHTYYIHYSYNRDEGCAPTRSFTLASNS